MAVELSPSPNFIIKFSGIEFDGINP